MRSTRGPARRLPALETLAKEMKIPIIALLGATALIGSCSSMSPKVSKETVAGCCHMQTAEEGRTAAKRDLAKDGFKILRYDMIPVRMGNWDSYNRPFKHFGIREEGWLAASIEFSKAYNNEMDRALLKRYGSEYRRLRSKILPPQGAKRWESTRS